MNKLTELLSLKRDRDYFEDHLATFDGDIPISYFHTKDGEYIPADCINISLVNVLNTAIESWMVLTDDRIATLATDIENVLTQETGNDGLCTKE